MDSDQGKEAILRPEAPTPFDLWLKRSLMEQYGPLLKEPPSDAILRLLNPPDFEG